MASTMVTATSLVEVVPSSGLPVVCGCPCSSLPVSAIPEDQVQSKTHSRTQHKATRNDDAN